MLDWERVIFRSFYYIGILSPFVFFICVFIICYSQYLKQKSEKEQEISRLDKKYKKQNKPKHLVYADIASESSTESPRIMVENPNQHLYKMDEMYSEMNSSVRDSIKGNSINITDKRHLKYFDTRSFTESKCTSEDETDACEELLHSQNERFNFQEEPIPPKLKKPIRNIESKCRGIKQKVIHNDNSKVKQSRCNSDDINLHSIQINKRKQDYPTRNPNYDDISLTIEPEVIHKINNYKTEVRKRECEGSSRKNVSNNNEMIETDNINSTQRFQQNGFENDQEYMVKLTNKSALSKTCEKCPMCTVSTQTSVSEMQQGKSFLHGRYNPGEVISHNKDLRASLFQNSNIPIAKRVLEDDKFHDLREKFCGTENIFLNASTSMKDEPSFNAWNKNHHQVYQFDENDYSFKDQKHFEKGNRKNTTKQQHSAQIANFTEETGDENQTENVSSICDSTSKEELLCNYWKSLKMKTDNQKRNKAVQTDIFADGQTSTELVLEEHADEAYGLYEPQEAIFHNQAKQTITKQAQDTKMMKNAQSSIQNQSTQTNGNKNPGTSVESTQIEIMEHHPKVQLFSMQAPYDERNAKIGASRNSKVFLSPTNHFGEINYAPKTGTLSCRPRQMQTDFQYPCHTHILSNYAQPIENSENIQYCENCYFRPNFPMKWETTYNRCNADCALQNKHNYICNSKMPMKHYENNQYLRSYNYITQRQMQSMCPEQQNMHLRNHFTQSGQHDENKYRISAMEKPTYYKNEDTYPQTRNRQMSNFCESLNKISVATHQHISNNSSTVDFNNQTNSWIDEHAVMQENGFHETHRNKKYKDNSTQHSLHNSRNNRPKIHNNEADTDVKEVQAFKEILITPNHTKEYGKKTLKETARKSNSQIKVNTEQAIEKSTAEQIQAKENVLKQIKRMYSHIDSNVHETNNNVITEVKKVLKTRGIKHSESK